jgi:hypothetical protein
MGSQSPRDPCQRGLHPNISVNPIAFQRTVARSSDYSAEGGVLGVCLLGEISTNRFIADSGPDR